MIEAIFSIVLAIIEAIVSMVGVVVEAVAGIFAAGGHALSAGEVFILLFVLVAETFYWAILWILELFLALLAWRKPRKVPRPVFWRPQKRSGKEKQSDENA
ncbi:MULTISPECIES: hypothetical protein [unclassified Pseudomonas]|uniref:hypothetical protein n=1 Tax=unclassified Pseudomonas TaxID=196821 RepID=UPI00244C76E3|nr:MULTISPECIES: hypothetical protein [unclassified Pseudomonas]MDG9926995.1 hypothetical protein [Pseudomonas sp. GD04042]MDH0485906.1 hypothetical protein [Pseudomonas sp. GD04015]MDH0602410.1 hypothetical protein [Pseudomonas sp. GD03869]